jgi:mono/diheme cytochrome c family protein
MKSSFTAAFAMTSLISSAAFAADATKGRETFVKNGCYSCHGYNGQGGNTGPKLAPDPMELDALKSFIRSSAPTLMPAYSEHVLGDADVADIHAWLASQPKMKNPKEIPLLSQ